jgi:hypothetical protein
MTPKKPPTCRKSLTAYVVVIQLSYDDGPDTQLKIPYTAKAVIISPVEETGVTTDLLPVTVNLYHR